MIKKLLLISGLILSSSLWAEKIAFSCENIKENPFQKEMIMDFVIDTKKKTASNSVGSYNYKEKGDEIFWGVEWGRFVMNRMTGTLLAQQRSNSFVWMTIGTLKCKKAEKLF